MSLTQVSFKTHPRLKDKALAKTARDGITLKALLTMAMRAYVADELEIGVRQKGEMPSPYLLQAMTEAEADLKKGRASPAFDNADDALRWLHRKRRSYAGTI